MNRRRTLLQGAGSYCLLSMGIVNRASAASIVDVRLWPANAYTRLTIESDTPLDAQHFVIDGPDRLVIDIQDMKLSTKLRELVGKVNANDPYIAGIRVGQFLTSVVRLAIDLKQPVRPQQFALQPIAAYRHRLVFDLYPTVAPDPLTALLPGADAPTASQDSEARAVDDALGELIGRASGPSAVGTPEPPTVLADASGASQEPATAAQPARPASGQQVSSGSAPASAPSSSKSTSKPSGKTREAARARIDRLIVVALDPGHGGEDPGATGPSGLREKDVVLTIARLLRTRLNKVTGMRAMLTRDDDYFVPLHERVARARKVQADLFVSLHADAFINPKARGASVFALSSRGASSTTARWIAKQENAADLVGGANLASKETSVLRTLLDMSTTAQIKDSMKVGKEVLVRISKVGQLHKPQVEQASFAVLKAPDIPSILVETAFISNVEEEKRLRDPAFLARLVDALADGIQRYFKARPPLARDRTT